MRVHPSVKWHHTKLAFVLIWICLCSDMFQQRVVMYVFSNYSWDDADSRCRSLGMSLPSVKSIEDVESIRNGHASEKQECGLMTFLAMRRDHKASVKY